METFFAPAKRCSKEELQNEIRFVSTNPVISGLMKTLSGLFAVLDEHRQVIAINDSMLDMLGYANSEEVLGLRPGEILHCIHAYEEPSGCGTTKSCITCGAAIAILAGLEKNTPQERICAVTLKKDGKEFELCFQVRSYPVQFEEHRFLLLFLQDITNQQKWASLETVFFHDINNLLGGMFGIVDLLSLPSKNLNCLGTLKKMLRRLKNEIEIQRVLCESKTESYQMLILKIKVSELIEELQNSFLNHPITFGKCLVFPQTIPDVAIETDFSLLLRVLTNMVTNALEATDPEHEVRIGIVVGKSTISFTVWNHQVIPEEIRPRIYQRHFTTKTGDGRGIGTFSMKLFGEDFLKGALHYTSSKEHGTLFTFTLPLPESYHWQLRG